MNLAIFVDQVFWDNGEVCSTDEAFIEFPLSFRSAFGELTFVGRISPEKARLPHVLPPHEVSVCRLPFYPNLYQLWKAGPGLFAEIRRKIRAHAARWDVVWITGPNPVALVVAAECLALGRPVFFVVRQNLARQVRFANAGFTRVLAVAAGRYVEWRFQRLARGRTVFTVGQEMADSYRRVTDRVHLNFPTGITNAALAGFTAARRDPVPGRLLCVGRLSGEKGHRCLLRALAEVNRRDARCTLDVVGTGPLENTLRAEAAALGLRDQVRFLGQVPFGPELFSVYQRACALVVPSLTEGVPQVMLEGLAIGLPIIASAVGGIPAFLTHGQTGLLVPPRDVPALVGEIARVLNDPRLCARLGRNGQALMQGHTLEVQRDRMVEIIEREVLSHALAA